MSNIQLFVVELQAGTGLPGAPELHLSLAVDTVTRQLSGIGAVSQAVNPPLDMLTYVKGAYFLLPILPPAKFPLQVHLTGVPALTHPLSNVVMHPNTQIYMMLNQQWNEGVCTYKYEVGGVWHTVSDVPVKAVKTEAISSF